MISCKPKETVEVAELYGKWKIEKADRNGLETPYLRGGYFIFQPDGQMIVNITGEDETGTFSIDKETISMVSGKSFTIQSSTPDSLIIAYQSNPESDFLFYLVRDKGEAQ
jgi:hypothetical protein